MLLLCMKFNLLINVEMHNFNIHEQDKFCAQELSMKNVHYSEFDKDQTFILVCRMPY